MERRTFEYEVVLSFAGEDRAFVSGVANCLKRNHITFFYDEFEEEKLWGKNLYDHLHDIYSNKARYCVMFVSKYYAEKAWPTHERESAQERALKEKGEYILPLRFDNTKIPGLKDTIGYVPINSKTPEEICKLIIKKLDGPDTKVLVDFDDDSSIPQIKRTISELEKDKFLNDAFGTIRSFFESSLELLKKRNLHCDVALKDYSHRKFTAEIHVEGKLKVNCKIWIGSGSLNHHSINYLENTSHMDVEHDGSMNDSAHLEDNGIEMYFHLLMAGFSSELNIDQHKASPSDVSKYFWNRFIHYLKY